LDRIRNTEAAADDYFKWKTEGKFFEVGNTIWHEPASEVLRGKYKRMKWTGNDMFWGLDENLGLEE